MKAKLRVALGPKRREGNRQSEWGVEAAFQGKPIGPWE